MSRLVYHGLRTSRLVTRGLGSAVAVPVPPSARFAGVLGTWGGRVAGRWLLPLEVKQGDVTGLPLALIGPDGSPLDLTGAVVTFRAWEEGTEADAVGPLTLVSDDPASGVAVLVLTPAAVAALDRDKRYWYDVKLDGGGTVAEGRLYVEAARIR
jgi:hypothetical protein